MVDVVTIFRNSPKDADFEATRLPDAPSGSMEYFHICRASPFSFSGGLGSRDPANGRPIVRLTRIAYSDRLDAFSAPLMGGPPLDGAIVTAPPPLVHVNSEYWRGVLAVCILTLDAETKAMPDLAHFTLRGSWTDAFRSFAKIVVSAVIMFGVGPESGGFMVGLSRSLWFGRPLRPQWVVRIVCYLAIAHQMGLPEVSYNRRQNWPPWVDV